MTGNLNLGSNRIIVQASHKIPDGVNKAYVDTVALAIVEFDKLRDTTIKKATPDASNR